MELVYPVSMSLNKGDLMTMHGNGYFGCVIDNHNYIPTLAVGLCSDCSAALGKQRESCTLELSLRNTYQNLKFLISLLLATFTTSNIHGNPWAKEVCWWRLQTPAVGLVFSSAGTWPPACCGRTAGVVG